MRPPTGGGTCFLAGTPILRPEGHTTPIEQLRVGDMVMAYDEADGQLKADAVKETFTHQATAYLVVNGHLRVTPEHPVYANGRWVEIGTLGVGDVLLNAQGQPEPITSMERMQEAATVYNLEVNPYHTYVAGGIVVHNKVGGGNDNGGSVQLPSNPCNMATLSPTFQSHACR